MTLFDIELVHLSSFDGGSRQIPGIFGALDSPHSIVARIALLESPKIFLINRIKK
jgi:hypothetical protein